MEVTTPVIQDVNDSQIEEIAKFLASIDPEIPWHIFRLLPEHEMKSAEYPSIERISLALESARKKIKVRLFP